MKKRWILAVTAAGLLGTTAAASATGLIEKVSGVIRNDVTVTVDGGSTGMKPVFINGQAYLPVRDEAEALGYEASYNAKDKQLELHKAGGEEAAEYARISGVIQKVEAADGGAVRIDAIGNGNAHWIILTADKDTVIKDSEGNAFAAGDLKAGMQLTAEYGPVVAMSYPGQSHAASITVGMQTLIREDVVKAVEKKDGGWQVQFGERTADGASEGALTLNAGKETVLLDSERQPVKWEDLAPGTKVRAYYGPIMTKSLPPQSPLHVLVVLSGTGSGPDSSAETP
ncbi:stalk domain-containing protein [Cohnella zeiphila]|uniref:Copper amine oxidase-like N-terminal domain-containing protein n=1 Tax=Cohnella zeiphila TaxID=2761120 RepID=A0A7X0VZX0_9BACL|nr:hypothetical protein [Cohnella zeiphila]MBB6735997.1 hypothetical protein [Cohnella zeiphila]